MLPALCLFAPILLFYQSFSYGQHNWPEYDIEDEKHFLNDGEQWNDFDWSKETELPEIDALYIENDEKPVFYKIDEERPVKWSNLVEIAKATTESDTNINIFSKIRSPFDFDQALETIQDKRLINNDDRTENKRLTDVGIKYEIAPDYGNIFNETLNDEDVENNRVTNDSYTENKMLLNNDQIEFTKDNILLEDYVEDIENEKLTGFDLLDLLRNAGLLNEEFEEEIAIDDETDETTLPLDLGDRVTEMEEELEIMEECGRNARASECECTAFPQLPFYSWYHTNPYIWPLMPMPYYVPYAIPVPIPVPTDAAVQGVPVAETVPVKGKVTIVGRFNDCNWNYPQYIPPEFNFYNHCVPPVANPVPYCDVSAPESFVPYADVIPVSGRVKIAAKFDDGVFGPFPSQQAAHFVTPTCQQLPYIPALPQVPTVPQIPAIPEVDFVIPEVPVCGQVPAYGEVTIAAQF